MNKLPPDLGSRSDREAKKTYHKPELFAYGDVREITRSIENGSGMNDSVVHGNDKTAP